MKTPYIGFSDSTLNELPAVQEDEEVPCDDCPGMHHLVCGKNKHGEKSSLLMFYTCSIAGKIYLGALNNKLVMFKKPDVSGII